MNRRMVSDGHTGAEENQTATWQGMGGQGGPLPRGMVRLSSGQPAQQPCQPLRRALGAEEVARLKERSPKLLRLTQRSEE